MNVSDIIFEYTGKSIHAAQGSGPSFEEGYDIWLINEDGWMDFLGFCGVYELERNMKIYQDQGDKVFIRGSKNEI